MEGFDFNLACQPAPTQSLDPPLEESLDISKATVWGLSGKDECRFVQVAVNSSTLEAKVLTKLTGVVSEKSFQDLLQLSPILSTAQVAGITLIGQPREVKDTQKIVRQTLRLVLGHVNQNHREVGFLHFSSFS